MREIIPDLTLEIRQHIGNARVSEAHAYPVARFQELVQHIARLAHLNKDQLLFFRGQSNDHRNKAGSTTVYPSIYRGARVPHAEILRRFQILEESSRQLSNLFERHQIEGHQELVRKTYVQWSILQHYEVCSTPLLDLTHSIPVACSFAQYANKGPDAYVFVFGLPYISNRIAINSEHDLVNVRLLSISPPDALRPYFQEGYLAGTTDITSEYPDKSEFDFNRRLVAKFRIPNTDTFWGDGFARIPQNLLYPDNDEVESLCNSIEASVSQETVPGRIESFIQVWSRLERLLVSWAREYEERVGSTNTALSVLQRNEVLGPDMLDHLHELRRFRNTLIHKPDRMNLDKVAARAQEVAHLTEELEALKGQAS